MLTLRYPFGVLNFSESFSEGTLGKAAGFWNL